jgi:hypothetical protein
MKFIIFCAFLFSFVCLSISKVSLKFTKQREKVDKFKKSFQISNWSFWQNSKAKQKRNEKEK